MSQATSLKRIYTCSLLRRNKIVACQIFVGEPSGAALGNTLFDWSKKHPEESTFTLQSPFPPPSILDQTEAIAKVTTHFAQTVRRPATCDAQTQTTAPIVQELQTPPIPSITLNSWIEYANKHSLSLLQEEFRQRLEPYCTNILNEHKASDIDTLAEVATLLEPHQQLRQTHSQNRKRHFKVETGLNTNQSGSTRVNVVGYKKHRSQ